MALRSRGWQADAAGWRVRGKVAGFAWQREGCGDTMQSVKYPPATVSLHPGDGDAVDRKTVFRVTKTTSQQNIG